MKNEKTILVTGGAGFIGANLIRMFSQKNTSTFIHLLVEKNTNFWRLTDLIKKLTIHEVDLVNFDLVTKLIHSVKPTDIFHLASFGGMPNQLDSKIIYDVNFYGTMNLLQACRQVGFDVFVNTGSSSEYGMKEEPMGEDIVLDPISDYGVAKAAATQFCQKEAIFNKLPIYTVRPFSVYGDYEMPTRLIPTILVNAILNKPIKLSSPHFVRDFIYIHDMVSTYLAIAETKPQNNFIFNGGTGVQSSIKDVINTVQKLVPQKLSVEWGKSVPRPWEPKSWQADITRSKQQLNWQPNYKLLDGLKKSLEWFKKHLDLYHKKEVTYENCPISSTKTTGNARIS